MKLILYFVLCLPLIFISGCNIISNSDSNTEINKYAGNWYSQEIDYYIRITNDGKVYKHYCSIDDGYESDGSLYGIVINDALTYVIGDPAQITAQENEISFVDFGLAVSFEKRSEIPEVCNNNAIKITFYSPEEATEGELTTFVINFDYRLSSPPSAIIRVGVAPRRSEDFIQPDVELIITEKGLSSGSLTVQIKPLFFADKQLFKLYILMYIEQEKEGITSSITIASEEVYINGMPSQP